MSCAGHYNQRKSDVLRNNEKNHLNTQSHQYTERTVLHSLKKKVKWLFSMSLFEITNEPSRKNVSVEVLPHEAKYWLSPDPSENVQEAHNDVSPA